MSTFTTTAPSTALGSRPTVSDREVEQQSLARTIVLHLAPGLIALGLYLVSAPWIMAWGFPPDFAYAAVAGPVCVILLEMRYLFYQGYARNGRVSLDGIVLYRRPMPLWQYGVFILLVVAWNAVVYMPLYDATAAGLKNALYFWAPSWFLAESDFALYPQNIALVMALVSIPAYTLFGVFEELYFRGYLLPRISRFGIWAPILSTALFTVYHFDILQNSVSVFVGFLPIALLTWRKQNVYLAVIAHAALNLINALAVYLPLLMR